jgi:hypothetical protein
MSAAMERAPASPWHRAGWVLMTLVLFSLAAPGCAHLRARKSERLAPPMLGAWRKHRHPQAMASPVDPSNDVIAQRLTRPEGVPAAALADRGGRSALVTTRSTAPPPDAVLPTAPLAVQAAPPAEPGQLDLDGLPPLDLPDASSPPPTSEILPAPAAPPAVSNPSPPSDGGLSEIRRIVDQARSRLASIQTYQVRMTRQERVGEDLQPAEDVLLSVRREPRAVRLEWPEGPNQGREVIYAAGANGGLMHIKMPNALVPRLSMPPDSPLALRNSRHPITEAGLDAVVEKLDATVRAHESGDLRADRLSYEGIKKPLPDGPSCHTLVRVTAEGETWVVSLDSQTLLPFLVQATRADGQLLERYVFRDPTTNPPELASASAFDPDGRWGASKGLLSRLARSAAESEPAAPVSR